MSYFTEQFENFMAWLTRKHPDIQEKYSGNFSIPFKVGGGITVNNNNKISQEEFEMLHRIAASYYDDSKK